MGEHEVTHALAIAGRVQKRGCYEDVTEWFEWYKREYVLSGYEVYGIKGSSCIIFDGVSEVEMNVVPL